MLRRISALLILVIAVATSVSLATARPTGKKHKLTATVRLATISSSSNFPAVGSKTTDAGLVTAKPGGQGAERDTLKVKSMPAPNTINLSGPATLFYALGSQTAKVLVKGVVASDGSVSYSGSGKFTKGTGIYKGVTGKFTFTGSSPAGSTVVTLHAKGTVTY